MNEQQFLPIGGNEEETWETYSHGLSRMIDVQVEAITHPRNLSKEQRMRVCVETLAKSFAPHEVYNLLSVALDRLGEIKWEHSNVR